MTWTQSFATVYGDPEDIQGILEPDCGIHITITGAIEGWRATAPTPGGVHVFPPHVDLARLLRSIRRHLLMTSRHFSDAAAD